MGSVFGARMKLSSTAFRERGKIPSLYTCEGKNINPPLTFEDIPKETKTLVLIMDDPDVPKTLRADGMWDHWVLFNIPPSTHSILENAKNLPGTAGKTTSNTLAYIGPCPPDREHRYFFKLFALDISLELKVGATKAAVESAMEGHILAKAQLMGLYEKHKRT